MLLRRCRSVEFINSDSVKSIEQIYVFQEIVCFRPMRKDSPRMVGRKTYCQNFKALDILWNQTLGFRTWISNLFSVFSFPQVVFNSSSVARANRQWCEELLEHAAKEEVVWDGNRSNHTQAHLPIVGGSRRKHGSAGLNAHRQSNGRRTHHSRSGSRLLQRRDA